MADEKIYYIYFHINPLKNEVFYVGKGKGKDKRAYSKQGRNKYWNNTVNKYGLIVNLIETGLTNEEAKEREIFYINKLGRKDLGTGSLVNMVIGGEGGNGRKKKYHTEEERIKAYKEHKKKYIRPAHVIENGKRMNIIYKKRERERIKQERLTMIF
jgi:hypothetical protein